MTIFINNNIENEYILFIKNFINNIEDESLLFIDNYKLVKVNNSIIYNSHIRNNLNKIFIDSISVERTLHVKDYIFYMNNYLRIHYNKDILFSDYNNLLKYLKDNLYLEDEKYCRDIYNNIFNINYTDSIEIDDSIFFIDSYDYCSGFCHTICYFYPRIYFFYLLQKYIPNLLLVITKKNEYTDFILNLFNIENYKLCENNIKLINKNITYFVGSFNMNFSEYIINNYFYDIIVKKTLLLKNDLSDYPKKLLFLRNKFNTKNGIDIFLENRDEIVKICENFGYVDMDQTLYNMETIIKIVNNSTHIIFEGGSSTMHLLWTKNIRAIMINYRMEDYYNSGARDLEYANDILKLVSDNMLADIIKFKNIDVIHNDEEYIKTGQNLKRSYKFTNTEKLINTIKKNE